MMKTLLRSLIFTFTIFLVLAEVKGQSPSVDSLRQVLSQYTEKDSTYVLTLLKLVSVIRYEDTELSTRYVKEAVALSKTLSNKKLEARAYNYLGINYGMKDQYADAIQSFNHALELGQQTGHLLLTGEVYNNLGIIYKRMGDYTRSLGYHFRAEKVYDSLQYKTGIARISNNLGSLYNRTGDVEQAGIYYKKAQDNYLALSNEKGAASAQLNLGLLYLKNKDFDKAYSLLDSTLIFCTQNNLLTEKVLAMNGIGEVFLRKKVYDRAEAFLFPALVEAERLKLHSVRESIFHNLAILHIENGNPEKSKYYAEKSLEVAMLLNNVTLKSKAEKLLSYVYEKSGQWKEALGHYRQYKIWEDSIFNQNTTAQYKSQQVMMEVYRKDRQIEEQALQMTFLDRQLALENKWKWTLGAASLFLLLAGIFYYQKYRIRKIHGHQLEEQMALRKETDDTINYFATSLFGKNTIDEILWDVAKNCIARLGLVDCVIYWLDCERDVLVQKAAFGTKNPEGFSIHQPLEIPLGQGIVGSVAQTGEAEIVDDTTCDSRYIVDDEARLSELAVPLKIQGRVVGVIDSEHPKKGFFRQYHLDSLKTIAAICSSKIAQTQAYEETRKAEITQIEAEKIKAIDQMKSIFFANISHEFRTPLNLILAPLQTYTDSIPSHITEVMRRNAQRLLRLVNQLLDLAKLEVGELKLTYQNADIFQFLRVLSASFSSMAETRNITYQSDIPFSNYFVLFDADKLEKIVYNLLSNAIKFTPPNGKVTIQAFLESPMSMRLVVSDTGPGIPPEVRDKIFDRFYQVDSSYTRGYEGSGIGLALTRELVMLHEGTIEVESQEGEGSTFIVNLPLKQTEEVPPQKIRISTVPSTAPAPVLSQDTPASTTEVSEDSPVILVVEDNDDLRAYVCEHLGTDFRCLAAANGLEGLNKALEEVPDMIITDVMMPEMDGATLTHKLKSDERTCHIPVLMLTARDDARAKQEGFRMGADQYLTKPFEIKELQVRINNLLIQRERLRQKFSREITLQPKEITLDDRDAKFVEKVMEVIEENISCTEFSLETLQREIGMSRMQMHRKVKALTGHSPGELIRLIRLKRAAQLLKQSGVQVTEVAYAVGFNSLSYFAKSFKGQFGVLPSAYQTDADQ